MRRSIGVLACVLGSTGLGCLAVGCGPSAGGRSAGCVEPRAAPIVVSDQRETLASSSSEPTDGATSAPRVAVGECDVGWLPPGTVVDVSPEETESLAEALRVWLDEGAIRELLVETRRGIVYAKSEDDLGADPPHPTRTRAQSALACGISATWLTDHIRADFVRAASPEFGGVTCQDNVCCYSGMEYMSDGYLVARRETIAGTRRWIIEAYVQVAEAALVDEAIARNRTYVASAIERERARTCRDEPAGHQ